MARKNKQTAPDQDAVTTVEVGQGTDADNGARIAELTAERDQLRAKLAEVEGELRSLTGSATPSTVARPVALVREVFESMPDEARKDVIARRVRLQSFQWAFDGEHTDGRVA
jgi:outer membrane protein TolC